MRKIGLILLLMINVNVFAQGRLTEEKKREFEAQKVAFFTKELELTPEEAAIFWPLYNEMRKKMGEADKEMRIRDRKIREAQNVKEAEYKETVEQMLVSEQKVTTTKKIYYEKMLAALPAGKVWKLEQAERKFHKQLFDKLRRESHPQK